MNYKLLFPTYRTRYLFLEQTLQSLSGQGRIPGSTLHLGTGEGDYDRLIHSYVGPMVSCDINEQDIAFARELNRDLQEVEYRVEDAQALSFTDSTFELVIAIDVLEHVPDSQRMLQEVERVLKPGGTAIISFPHLHFPVTYDPVNRFLALFGEHLPFGAYGFGHTKLFCAEHFQAFLAEGSLEVESQTRLTRYLAALTEMYWPGILQRLWKANSGNRSSTHSGKFQLRPSKRNPPLLFLTDLLIRLDAKLFAGSRASVGLAYLVRKPL